MLGDISQEHIDYMLARVPMGRLARAEEVAELIAYLASDRMTFSTGAAFDHSGGQADVLMGTFVPRGWRLVRLGGGAEPRLARSTPPRRRSCASCASATPWPRCGRGLAALRRRGRRTSTSPTTRRRSRRCRCSRRSLPDEIWAAGVTYERSRHARIEESESSADVYALVYDAERPELFLKDAGCRRTVGPGEASPCAASRAGRCRSRSSGSCSTPTARSSR